jgi:protein-disulfide isomerase
MPNRRDVLSLMGIGAASVLLPLARPAHAEMVPALGEMTLGPVDAPVTVIEYFSLGCSHCRDFHARTFTPFKEAYLDTGKVHFIARDFPNNEPALRAAMLARCAGEDRYFAFVDTLFDGFDFWAVPGVDNMAALAQIAALGGMPRAQFDACLANTEIESVVLGNQLLGMTEHEVEYTPTFIIEGRKHVGAIPYDELVPILDRHLGEV